MDSISYWLYFAVTVWNVMLIVAVAIFICVIVRCLRKHPDTSADACYTPTMLGTKLNAICFLVLSILLVASVIPLSQALLKIQRGRMKLTRSVKILFAVFFVFTVCYVSRAIYDVTVDPNLKFANLFSGLTLPILWDFLPIFLMFLYHYMNMRKHSQNDSMIY